jgi:protein-L-isoaspartate(D-aspartate) O-methyltransferase
MVPVRAMIACKFSLLGPDTWLLAAVAMVAVVTASCTRGGGDAAAPARQSVESVSDRTYSQMRGQMVAQQLAARDIADQRVLAALGRVPRHNFVPAQWQRWAYDDRPLPIGHGQTISQPYIVALMTQLADPKPNARALDVGTGSGYQAAVLAELTKHVYSIEIVAPLADEARRRLQSLGYENIEVRHGDGYRGWPEKAPFDVIIVAAAPDHVPQPLVEQLAPGGKMVIPVGDWWQELTVVEKAEDGTVRRRSVAPVAFVPMTGEAERSPPPP